MAKNKLPSKRLFGVKIIKYRIVTDCYSGFECQKWRILFPIWTQMGFTNTHSSIERAIDYINKHKHVVMES